LKREGQGNPRELGGTTFKVYKYLLKANKPVRVSDLQRGLGASSPSLIEYHLKKLLNLGLIREEQAGYVVERVVIESIFRIRGMLVPFQLSYVVFFGVTLTAMVAIGWSLPLTSFKALAIGANVSALIASVYELMRTLRSIS
jgi:DNA-binding transcriptional ArsR family regulator